LIFGHGPERVYHEFGRGRDEIISVYDIVGDSAKTLDLGEKKKNSGVEDKARQKIPGKKLEKYSDFNSHWLSENSLFARLQSSPARGRYVPNSC
jgi:hypothetical protein